MADVNLSQATKSSNSKDSRAFLSGVVEGFYGRPWTPEQRKELFCKQEKWGMNCYLYAPKDDYKHRAFWRELYTVEEAEHLQALITEANRHNILFYYAISPGLDITYSSQKELSALKRKLEQVQQLGCCAFALLFDDIDPEMSGADKEVYQSFAHAQVSVANEIFGHLDEPKFMLCPTQYCTSRAVPSVQTSEYLNTLGAKLAPDIDIMWTGPKVISKTLTVEHIREVSSVLRRAPVIWDNLHANDYDQARLFLGPYCGRSPSLIPLLRGVVTNPNCEYGPNFIAIHTLAQWSKSAVEESCGDASELKDDAVSADIRLETECDDISSSYCPTGLPSSTYHPRRALKLALQDWLLEFNRPVLASGPIQQPQILTAMPIVPSVNTCMSLTSTTAVAPVLPAITSTLNQLVEVIQDSNLNPPSNVVMNSLTSENKVDTISATQLPEAESTSTISQDGLSTTSSAEPMDCNQSPASSPAPLSPSNVADPSEDQMVVESIKIDGDAEFSPTSQESAKIDDDSSLLCKSPEDSSELNHHNPDLQLTLEDLLLLADLFYLPFEHGKQGTNIMTEFNWLKMNSYLVIEQYRNNVDGTIKPEVQEWFHKASKFEDISKSVKKMSERLFNVRNRSLLYELYPYVWDMRGVVSLLSSYVQWLALGQVSTLVSNYVNGNHTWFSKGWREAFMSGDMEPWIFRGGLTAELQRLIPVDASNDLFMYKPPDVPQQRCYVIRPYMASDKNDLCRLVLNTADDGKDASSLYTAHPQLPTDLIVGSFLELAEAPLAGVGGLDNSVVVMVVEDNEGALAGYCCAATSGKTLAVTQAEHLVKLRERYPKVVREEGIMLTPCEQLLASLLDEPLLFPTPTVVAPPTPPTAMSQGATPPPSVSPPQTEELCTNDAESIDCMPPSADIPTCDDSATSPSEEASTANTKLVSSPDVTPTSQDIITTPTEPTATNNNTVTTDVPTTTSVIASVLPPTGAPLTPSPTPSPDPTLLASKTTISAIQTSLGDLLPYYPAAIVLGMMPSVMDESICKRLVTCIFASLRSKGGFGGHVCVPRINKNNIAMYAKLGFSVIGSHGDMIYLARSF